MTRYQLGKSCHFGISLKYLSPPHSALNNFCASCCILWLQSFKHSCWKVPFCGSEPLQVMHAFHSSLEWRTYALLNTACWFLQTTLLHPPQPPDYLSVITNFLFPENTHQLLSCFVLVEPSQSAGEEWPQWDLANNLIMLVLPLLLQLTRKKPQLGKPTTTEIPQRSSQRELCEPNTVRNFPSLLKKKKKNQTKNTKRKIYTLTSAFTDLQSFTNRKLIKVNALNCTEKPPVNSLGNCTFQIIFMTLWYLGP